MFHSKHLTRDETAGGESVIRLMGFKKLKNGKSMSGVKLTGNCCVKIFERSHFRGLSQKIEIGHNGPINFRTLRSIKFGVCSWL